MNWLAFRLNEAAQIAEFIQDSLAGVVAGYVESLKLSEELGEFELRIKL